MTTAPPLELPPLPAFASPRVTVRRSARRLRSPTRIPPAAGAAKVVQVYNPGGGTNGPWSPEETPYMIAPMNATASRSKTAVVFVGPAQSGKTQGLLPGLIGHWVVHDPADCSVVHMTRDRTASFSEETIGRMNRYSPKVWNEISPAPHSDNIYRKRYRNMTLRFRWPVIAELSGHTTPRMLLTDYDRMPLDISGEGSCFDLARKRTQTFGSRGITVAESSPGWPILDPRWSPDQGDMHEAPPTEGILALYNRGDRARWYWPCPQCNTWFEGSFSNLSVPADLPIEEAAARVVMVCPTGCFITPLKRDTMNAEAQWVAAGQRVTDSGALEGEPIYSEIASFWLKGPAAAFQTWQQMMTRELQALAELERTGDEGALKTTRNTDQGEPYLPKAAEVDASVEAEALIARAEDIPLEVVPDWARFLVASVDVQKHFFQVLVRAYGVGLESAPIHFYTIFKTRGHDGKERALDPAVYIEDWDLLIDKVLRRRYPLQGETRKVMRVRLMVWDNQGRPGVAAKGYKFYAHCKAQGFGSRVIPSRGDGRLSAPRIRVSMPDSQRKDRKAKARGEVPVLQINTNALKDELQTQLMLDIPGPGYVHLPIELNEKSDPNNFFEQVTAEDRQKDGTWHKVKARNEAVDNMTMTHAGCLYLGADRIKWASPPAWAQTWDINSDVSDHDSPIKLAKPRRRSGMLSRGID